MALTNAWTAFTTNLSTSYTFLGSFDPTPVWTITVNSQTAMTALELLNSDTGTEIMITRTFANGDVVVIDAKNKTVKVNGTEVDYTGIIPKWNVGLNNFQINITATAKNITARLSYFKRFI